MLSWCLSGKAVSESKFITVYRIFANEVDHGDDTHKTTKIVGRLASTGGCLHPVVDSDRRMFG